ncbi:hypothetical protein PVK06_049912 [Gossypium arboreum]|uniref:Uncharacterized protein n=1 Tax=Gossypium arboreum TaxID=29729 RepID=A0ABR0M9D9_GOSAR|nr:hypothetical protein PVK06_049912 [Gossypium arboreum]
MSVPFVQPALAYASYSSYKNLFHCLNGTPKRLDKADPWEDVEAGLESIPSAPGTIRGQSGLEYGPIDSIFMLGTELLFRVKGRAVARTAFTGRRKGLGGLTKARKPGSFRKWIPIRRVHNRMDKLTLTRPFWSNSGFSLGVSVRKGRPYREESCFYRSSKHGMIKPKWKIVYFINKAKAFLFVRNSLQVVGFIGVTLTLSPSAGPFSTVTGPLRQLLIPEKFPSDISTGKTSYESCLPSTD